MIAQSVAEIISRVRLTVEGSTGCTSTCSCRTCSTSRESSTSSARIVVVAGAGFASYGLASHVAIINGKDSRKGRRRSRFQLKYRKQPHAK